jgi:S-methylmethionine-dependent homocysteine/selenocysteine methylase
MSVSMFVRALQEKKYLVLDGGLATELENNHVKLHPTLW